MFDFKKRMNAAHTPHLSAYVYQAHVTENPPIYHQRMSQTNSEFLSFSHSLTFNCINPINFTY